jgi:serine/threonine-protein kinase HipA
VSTLAVLLHGRALGTVEQDRAGRLAFEYDDEARRHPEATPLSLSMPLARARHGHDVVGPYLWGLLPDNPQVLQRWARDFGVSANNPFALLTHTGLDCAGAVQLVAPDRLAEVRDDGAVTWLDDDEIAAALRDLRADPTAWHNAVAGGQFSLAGAQAKLALHHDDRHGWGRPTGRVPTTHILKPAIAGLDDHDLDEHLCLDAGDRLGLVTALSEIGRFGDERAIVVTRYDRRRDAGGWHRVHQEDLCQALGVLPAAKYQHDGGPAPEQILHLFRQAMPAAAGDEATRDFLDALAFNWLLGGTDAHAKNYSLLLSGGDVRFAPLYDVASVLPHPDVHRAKLRLAMKVGGEHRLTWIRARHWDRLAADARVEPAELRSRITALAEQLPDALAAASAEPAVAELRSALPARLVDAVASWCEECTATMRRAS